MRSGSARQERPRGAQPFISALLVPSSEDKCNIIREKKREREEGRERRRQGSSHPAGTAKLEVPINLTKPGPRRPCQLLQAKQIVGKITSSQTNKQTNKNRRSAVWVPVTPVPLGVLKFIYQFSSVAYAQERESKVCFALT